MYGFNNMYGMGGYGRGGGGGMEMMLIVLCCVCCVCLMSVVGGWWSNAFCGLNASLGKSCTTPAPVLSPTGTEAPDTSPPRTLDTCNKTWANDPRAANDPRPALKAAACTATAKVTGRDCFYWQVKPDPLTGLSRWERLPDTDTADARDGACASPPVVCTPKIDFAKLSGYTDNNPNDLLRVCQVATTVAATNDVIVPALTKGASDARANTKKDAWTDATSRKFLSNGRIKGLLGGRDLQPIINNIVLAVNNVLLSKLNQRTIKRSTYAYMIEAALLDPTNHADWIYVTAAMGWKKDVGGTRPRFAKTEDGFVRALAAYTRRGLTNWVALIDLDRSFG